VLSVITRWEITIDLLNSVLKNQQALLNYFKQKNLDIDQERSRPLNTFINDYFFWKKLILVKKILDFIHQYQHMSKIESHKLYTIANNWNRIRAHLYSMIEEDEDNETDVRLIAQNVWEERYLSQIVDIHVIAALLILINHAIKIVDVSTVHAFSSIMHRFFNHHINAEDATIVMKQ
jgi:hypothetical protein